MSKPELLPANEIPLDRQLAMAESMIAPAWRNVAIKDHTDPNYRKIDEILEYTICLYRELGSKALFDTQPELFNPIPLDEL